MGAYRCPSGPGSHFTGSRPRCIPRDGISVLMNTGSIPPEMISVTREGCRQWAHTRRPSAAPGRKRTQQENRTASQRWLKGPRRTFTEQLRLPCSASTAAYVRGPTCHHARLLMIISAKAFVNATGRAQHRPEVGKSLTWRATLGFRPWWTGWTSWPGGAWSYTPPQMLFVAACWLLTEKMQYFEDPVNWSN